MVWPSAIYPSESLEIKRNLFLKKVAKKSRHELLTIQARRTVPQSGIAFPPHLITAARVLPFYDTSSRTH